MDQDDQELDSPIRVPGTHPPNWIPDNDVSSCQLCSVEFTLLRRRHHCRSCGKIFCSDCCHLKAKLPYLNNREARVCDSCVRLLAITLARPPESFMFSSSILRHNENERTHNNNHSQGGVDRLEADNTSSTPTQEYPRQPVQPQQSTSTNYEASSLESNLVGNNNQNIHVQSVLRTSSSSRNKSHNVVTGTTSGQQQTVNKQVIFSDGIRPGTDLCESSCSMPPLTSGLPGLERRNRHFVKLGSRSRRKKSSSKHNRESKSSLHEIKHVTLSDELGFLPPIVMEQTPTDDQPPKLSTEDGSSFSSVFGQDLAPDLVMSNESNNDKSNPNPENHTQENRVSSFVELARKTGNEENTVKFILLKNFYIYVKIIDESWCMRKNNQRQNISEKATCEEDGSSTSNTDTQNTNATLIQRMINSSTDVCQEFWYFRSEGLALLGRREVVFVLDKPTNERSLPRDVFKLYLTIHELSLRGQAFGNLGNLLFTDGLFGNKNVAGVLFTRPVDRNCFGNLTIPKMPFLVAILVQKWEVPWLKVFPLRLLLRLGIEHCSYPFMIASLRDRPPVYYEVGHTIIGILADLRNYRYSVESVPKLRIIVDKDQEKVVIKFPMDYYQQVMKVLSNSNNEHVLSWMSDICTEATSHLVSVQNDDGQHDTQVYNNNYELCDISKCHGQIGASFVIFSGALKATQPGQVAKISVVEDGLLIQIQSHTLTALRGSLQSMSEFSIETGGKWMLVDEYR